MSLRIILIGALAFVALLVGYASTFVVTETEQAIVVRLGEPQDVVRSPGLHLKAPLVDTVYYFDKRTIDYDADMQEIPTLDQKQLRVDSFARYRIVDPLLFFQSVKSEAQLRPRLGSAINTSLRNVLGNVEMAKMLTAERAALMKQISEQVDIIVKGGVPGRVGAVVVPQPADDRRPAQQRGFGIEIVDVRLKRVDLTEANSESVFNNMRSSREQEAKKIRAEGDRAATTKRADADREARVVIAEARQRAQILRGTGEAEAERIFREAYGRDAKFFEFYRSVQAIRKALTASSTTYIGPPDIDLFKLFETRPDQIPGGAPARPGLRAPSLGALPDAGEPAQKR